MALLLRLQMELRRWHLQQQMKLDFFLCLLIRVKLTNHFICHCQMRFMEFQIIMVSKRLENHVTMEI